MGTMNDRVKKLSFFDLKLFKWGTICFTLIIVKLIPEILNVNIMWFIGLGILFSIKPVYVLLSKN